MNIALPPSRYATDSQIARFFDQVINRVAAIPGVKSVAVSSALPLHPYRYSPMLPEGQPETPLAQRPALSIQAISPDYFKTMGIPLLEGRAFNERDKDGAPPVAMVNGVFAQRYWPSESAVGKHILLGTMTTPLEIVGVTGNIKNITLSVVATPEMYYPLAQRPSQAMNLIVRSAANPYSLLTPVRARILAADKEQPVTNVRSMEEHLAESIAPNRLTTLLLGIFSVVALVVATVGLYGSVAYSTAQRTQELGIRLALGAAPGTVLRLVMWQGLGLAILGVLAGLAGSLALTRVMQSLLFQVSAIDAWTYAVCAFLFVIVALAASYVPARRAAQLDPCEALRHE
jgi:putative ABC transport system permease protein